MPFTEDDFDPQLEQALELMPELLGAEGAEIRYAINGLLSLTADGSPILGESEVKGLWVSAAVWIKEGPGVGRAVAEWMTHGHSEIDMHHSDIARFHPHETDPRARPGPHQRGVHQDLRHRPPRRAVRAPTAASAGRRWPSRRRRSARSSTRPSAGSGRGGTSPTPACVEKYGDAVMPREHEWDARWWSPIINAEHLAMRENAGVDRPDRVLASSTSPAPARSPRCSRPASPSATSRSARSIYTPVLDAKGGFLSDLTVMRLGEDHFRVVTGGAHGMADRKWFTDHLVDGAELADLTEELSTIGLWGPRARDILASLTGDDVSDGGFGFLTCREITVKGVDAPVLASRISYVGELGWELYVPFAAGRRSCGTPCSPPGKEHGAVPVGIGVYGTTGRIEKGYRAFGAELDAERTHRRGRRCSGPR